MKCSDFGGSVFLNLLQIMSRTPSINAVCIHAQPSSDWLQRGQT